MIQRLTRRGILDASDVSKVGRVGYSQTPHAVGVPPFLQRQQTAA